MIAITGYTGFVGHHLLSKLDHAEVLLLGRKSVPDISYCQYNLQDSNHDNLFISLQSVQVVIHLAARVHIMNDVVTSPLEHYRALNRDSTLALARTAASAGVKRFIYLSSIKVNGEITKSGPFRPNDVPDPEDAYGISKAESELLLLELAEQTGMEIVIIRPPLVYGPGVKANFGALLNLASKGIPLPFACFRKNKRSLVSLDNLVDFIKTCIEHPKAANQVFLVSDDHDLSTSELIRMLSKACGRPVFMLPMPIVLFKLIAKLLGKKNIIERLSASLQIDISKSKALLNWAPPQSVEDGLKLTADAFLASKKQ